MARMRECANCGAAMQEGQDWCVQCGAARRGGLSHSPGWLTGAAVLAATALLVVGASVAAYAALSRHSHSAHKTLALRPSTTLTPGTVPPPSTPATPTTPTSPGAGTPPAPSGAAPPKIPTQTPTPEGSSGNEGEGGASAFFSGENGKASGQGKAGKASKPSKPSSGGKAGKGAGSGGNGSTEGVTEGQGGEAPGERAASKGSGGENGSNGEPKGPAPLMLDTNAATTYNPNSYPASLFGDPSLAIDGEASTAWSAAVQAAAAPRMADGLLIDLRSAQKLGSIKVRTSTPGFTVEAYGANGHEPPASIDAPAWKKLHGPRLLKRKSVTFKLKTKGAAYRYVLLWLVKAPAGSTAAAPGAVSISELELFAPR